MLAMEQPIYCVNRICKRALKTGMTRCPFCSTFQGETGPPPPIPEMPRYISGGWLDGVGGMMVTLGWLLLGASLTFLLAVVPLWNTLRQVDMVAWVSNEPALSMVYMGFLWPLAAFAGAVGMLWSLGRVSRAEPETPLLPLVAILGAIAFIALMCIPFLRTMTVTYMVLVIGYGVRIGVPLLERD